MTDNTMIEPQVKNNNEMRGASRAQVIQSINWIGMQTLAYKEIMRFITVYAQTLATPVITTLLYYFVFSLAFGGNEKTVAGIGFMQFVVPGLITMSMIQNAFANTSSSILIGKVQGVITDILIAPLSYKEIFVAYVTGAVVRGFIVGGIGLITLSLLEALPFTSILSILVFGLLGAMMLAVMGILAGMWAEKVDHISAFTNFFVMPLTFLSGTFYPLTALPEGWQVFAMINPFFHIINGVRYGVVGVSEAPLILGIFILIVINVILSYCVLRLLKSGYKLKS